MSRKHYREIAEALKSASAPLEVCKAVGIVMAKDNPRFQMGKFLDACGVSMS
jgi:hypothetical protein